MERVKIVVTIPLANADQLRETIGQVGAGIIGEYSYCSFSVLGTGRFKPTESAKPHIGSANTLESVEEERIEITCSRSEARRIIEVIKTVHPYEEPSIDIYCLLDESEL